MAFAATPRPLTRSLLPRQECSRYAGGVSSSPITLFRIGRVFFKEHTIISLTGSVSQLVLANYMTFFRKRHLFALHRASGGIMTSSSINSSEESMYHLRVEMGGADNYYRNIPDDQSNTLVGICQG